MLRNGEGMRIDPGSIAFDIDGVVADTMTLFIDIARHEYNIQGLKYEEITNYSLEACIDIPSDILDAIVQKLLDGGHKNPLMPIRGAPEVLSRIGQESGKLLFVTARPYPGPITAWMAGVLALPESAYEIVATGSFEAKAQILLERKVTCFVEDRLETCHSLEEVGVLPILFKQPWNRENRTFIEVDSWQELEAMIAFP